MAKTEEVFSGKGIEEKAKAFARGIGEIEQRHQDFFSGRTSPVKSWEQDHLANYFTLDYNSRRCRITFTEARLPVGIRVEVEELFDQIWS